MRLSEAIDCDEKYSGNRAEREPEAGRCNRPGIENQNTKSAAASTTDADVGVALNATAPTVEITAGCDGPRNRKERVGEAARTPPRRCFA